MAILKGLAQQSTAVQRVSEGDDVNLRATLDGALFTADWRQAMVAEGRGFMFNVGALSAPVAGGGSDGTALDIDAPEWIVRIPDGTSILPLYIEVTTATRVGTADDQEVDILIAVDQDALQTDGTFGTQPTVYNLNTLSSRGSNCTVDQQCSAAMTTPVNDLELAHMNKIFEKYSTVTDKGSITWTELRLVYEPKSLIIINGPAMLLGYWGSNGSAVQAFSTIQWLELPSSTV